MSSLWLVVLELISLAGEKGSLGEGMWSWVTEPGCSRGDLSSLKEEDRVDEECSWDWLALELMEELTRLLSGHKQNVTHPGKSRPLYVSNPVASHCHPTHHGQRPGVCLLQQAEISHPSITMNPGAEKKAKSFLGLS